jgi:hypothetical protein
MVVHDLDDLGYPPFRKSPYVSIYLSIYIYVLPIGIVGSELQLAVNYSWIMIVVWSRRSSYDYNYPNKYPSCNSWTYVSGSRTLVLNASVLWYLAPQFIMMIQFCMALFRIHTACSMQWLWVYPTTSTSDHLVVRYSSGPIRHIVMLRSGKIANIHRCSQAISKGSLLAR